MRKKAIILELGLIVVISLSCWGTSKLKTLPVHKVRLLGATYMTLNNPYFKVLHEQIKEAVEANGDILIVRNPLQDQEKQNEQIQNMIDEGIEVLFLNPVDWEGVQPAIVACKEANVPIINLDTSVKNTSYILSLIETNNYLAGQQCAEDMMKRVPNARILVLDNPIQKSITQRIRGFLEAIRGNSAYQVVAQENAYGEIEVSSKVVMKLLKEGVKFDVVFGGNDPTALGALAALQQYKQEANVLIYGVDGSPDFKAMIERGYVTGTSSQSPSDIGQLAVENAYRYFAGENIQKHIILPSQFISKTNLGEYEINAWQ